MGCVTSKTDINDDHPNIFKVMNVDEMCNPLRPGHLEVSELELILHQRGKTPVRWPIKSLRRYGFDAQLFSFECGRRCATGPGIYAFKCSRAEQLFNLLQTQVQMRNNPGDDTVSNSMEFNNSRQVESNYLEPAPIQQRNGSASRRLGSVGSSSNGPLSPLTTSPSPPPPPLPLPPATNTAYANIDITPSPGEEPATPTIVTTPSVTDDNASPMINELAEESPSSPVYMNVIPGQEIVLPLIMDPPPRPASKMEMDFSDGRHCYANLEPGELESLRELEAKSYQPIFQFHKVESPTTPTSQKMNYLILDLNKTLTPSSPTTQPTSPLVLSPESPNKPNESYATIDFDRTVALCAVSTCPAVDDEGSRKTRHNSTMCELEQREVRRARHNSTISELVAPIAARLSSSLSE